MSPHEDYIVDIDGLAGSRDAHVQPVNAALRGRPWLSVHWKCCGAYSRIYRNRAGDAYAGACPRCGKPVRAAIAANGTHTRFFEAY